MTQGRLGALDHAGPGDYGEFAAAEDHATRVNLDHDALRSARTLDRSGVRAALRASAALIRPRNSGWHSSGRDLSSGWNWQPRNHGWPGNSMISTSAPSGEVPVALRPAFSSAAR